MFEYQPVPLTFSVYFFTLLLPMTRRLTGNEDKFKDKFAFTRSSLWSSVYRTTANDNVFSNVDIGGTIDSFDEAIGTFKNWMECSQYIMTEWSQGKTRALNKNCRLLTWDYFVTHGYFISYLFLCISYVSRVNDFFQPCLVKVKVTGVYIYISIILRYVCWQWKPTKRLNRFECFFVCVQMYSRMG